MFGRIPCQIVSSDFSSELTVLGPAHFSRSLDPDLIPEIQVLRRRRSNNWNGPSKSAVDLNRNNDELARMGFFSRDNHTIMMLSLPGMMGSVRVLPPGPHNPPHL